MPRRLRANQHILGNLKEALRACDITNPQVCAVDPAATETMRLYVRSWIEGPLARAIAEMERE
jgi:hypothetical protein